MVSTATKAIRTLQASASNGDGATTTGAALDVTTGLGLVVTGRVTNGPSGPTTGCVFGVEVSGDGSDWFEWSSQQAGIGADEVSEFAVELPAAVMYVRTVFGGNTGQAVTVEAYGQELTGIG